MSRIAATDPVRARVLIDAPIVVIDLEMTGLKSETDRVIEVCARRYRGQVLQDELATLIDPGPDVVFGATHIHHISPEHCVGAPSFADVADRLEQLCADAVLVGHGIRYDVAFILAERERLGLSKLKFKTLDTVRLARAAFKRTGYKLHQVAESLEIPHENAHRASEDVEVTAQIFWRLVEKLNATTVGDLVVAGGGPADPRLWRAPLAGSITSKNPLKLRYRPSRGGVKELCFQPTCLMADLDPPLVLGYLLPSRGRRQLRIDRILHLEISES